MSAILEQRHDLGAFRNALRQWLQQALPVDWRSRMLRATPQAFLQFQRDWLLQLDAVGLAAPHWPSQWGGEDLSVRQQCVIYEELARADAPSPQLYCVSLYHLPATLFAAGTPAQIERYLPGVHRGEVWCQGFSEPNAGSDLASLRTRAERVGDRYIVNGQKIWSSFSHIADWCLLLARTDIHAPKHRGISYFILDMKSPGVTVRPIRQSTGEEEFGEVFLDNVEIPAENLIGAENDGWNVAQATLGAERGLLIFECAERAQLFFERMLGEHRSGGSRWFDDDQQRREFMQYYAELQAVRAMIRDMLGEVERSGHTGVLASYLKLHYSDLVQRFTDLVLRIRGLDGQLLSCGIRESSNLTGHPMFDHISTWGLTISGGSNEILRNIIAERILGLPREPKAA